VVAGVLRMTIWIGCGSPLSTAPHGRHAIQRARLDPSADRDVHRVVGDVHRRQLGLLPQSQRRGAPIVADDLQECAQTVSLRQLRARWQASQVTLRPTFWATCILGNLCG
jgi:hypothetical protein